MTKENDFLTRLDKQCHARAVDASNRTVRFLAQSTALASDNLVILPYAGKRHNPAFMINPIVVPSHMRYSMEGSPVVVGSVSETEFDDKGMYQTVRFADTELGEQYWILYRDGHMRMVSIAWDREDKREVEPAKMDTLMKKHGIVLPTEQWKSIRGVVTEYKQRDLSLVSIGADPKALAREAAGGNEAARSMVGDYRTSDAGDVLIPVTLARQMGMEVVSETDEDYCLWDGNRSCIVTPAPTVKTPIMITQEAFDRFNTLVDKFAALLQGDDSTATSEDDPGPDGSESAADTEAHESDTEETSGDDGGDSFYGELLEFDPTRKNAVPDDLMDLAEKIKGGNEK